MTYGKKLKLGELKQGFILFKAFATAVLFGGRSRGQPVSSPG
jgi:hypothetical protein